MTDTPSTITPQPQSAAPMRPPVLDDGGPEGIGGWLILPIIGLVGTIALTIPSMIAVFQPDNIAGFEAFFRGEIPAHFHGMMYVGLVSAADGIIGIGLAALCLIQIFRKKRGVPVLMTVFYIFTTFAYFIEWYGAAEFPLLRESDSDVARALGQAIGSVLRAAIWITYFWVSERVKNTFVH